MSYVKDVGIVIKEVNIGEADKLITLITKHHGKIQAFAKGSKRPRSKLTAGTQLLSFGNYLLFKGKTSYSVNNCELLDSFYEIRNDVVKLTYVAHMIDILSDAIQENQPARKILKLFLNTLHILARKNRDPRLIKGIFEIRILSLLGFAPFVDGCIICNEKVADNLLFSFKSCGFICKNDSCITNDKYAIKVHSGTARAIHHIVTAPMKELFSFEISAEVLQELEKISKKYLRERMEKEYNKLDFLKSL